MNLHKIWQRPVNLLTLVEGEQKVLVYDGGEARIEKASFVDEA